MARRTVSSKPRRETELKREIITLPCQYSSEHCTQLILHKHSVYSQ